MSDNEKLYHYTSKKSFLKIIESKSLFATDIRFLNDGMEADIVSRILNKLLSEDDEIKEALGNDKFYISEFYESFKGVGSYVVSFSGKSDDLNQWRCYASNCTGICIEFNGEKLFECLKRNKYKYDSIQLNFDLQKCIYDFEDQKTIIKNLILDYKNKSTNEKSVPNLITELLKCSAYFKDKSFEAEDEYRLIVTNVDKSSKKARLGRNAYIPYCEVKIEDSSKCPTDECEHPWLGNVIIGPNNPLSVIDSDNQFDYVLECVRQACFINGIEFCDVTRKLEKSKIPYRG